LVVLIEALDLLPQQKRRTRLCDGLLEQSKKRGESFDWRARDKVWHRTDCVSAWGVRASPHTGYPAL